MDYTPTLEQLIDDTTTYLLVDPRYFNQTEGVFEWWGRQVPFSICEDEITIVFDGRNITFLAG